MAGTCFTSLQLCALRVAQLTSAGRPIVPGTNRGYVTDAAIKLDVSIVLRNGKDLEQQNGCGAVCAAFKQPDRIKRLDLAMDLCQFDAQLIALFTGGSVISSGGNAVGYQFPPTTGGVDPAPLCLEVWTKAWAGNSPAVPAFTSPNAAYIHWVFPWTQWVHGNFTMQDDLMVVPVAGQAQENPRITSNGPFDDWPAVVGTNDGIAEIGGWFLDPTLPAVTCNYINTTSAAS